MENTVREVDGRKKEVVKDILTSLRKRAGKERQRRLMMAEYKGVIDRMQR